MSRRFAWTIVLATVAIALLWLWPRGSSPIPGRASEPGSDAMGVDATRAEGPGPTSGLRAPVGLPTEAQLPGADDTSRASTDGLAEILGRCVDEQGGPLAGVTVSLSGHARGNRWLEEWRLEHGPDAEWRPPEAVVTGTDGRFELRFEPAPGFWFQVDFKSLDQADAFAAWHAIRPGQRIDMGSVELPRGVLVLGQVVDTEGRPVAGAHVWIRDFRRDLDQQSASLSFGRSERDGEVQWPGTTAATTGPDGRFSPRVIASELGQEIKVLARPIHEPRGLVRMSAPATELRIVVGARMEHRVPGVHPRAIRGVVVDESGAPIHLAKVAPFDFAPFAIVTGIRQVDRDGSFVVAPTRTDDVTRPVRLTAFAEDHVLQRTAEPIPWGTAGVEIRLRRGPPVSVRVRDDDGAPIERFGVVLAPIRETEGFSSRDDRIRAIGDHPGGFLEFPAVSPARYRLSIATAQSLALVQAEPIEIEVRDREPLHRDVRLFRAAAQRVSVVGPGGLPAVGVEVELTRHRRDGAISVLTPLQTPFGAVDPIRGGLVRLDDSARTDEDGSATLRAAPGVDYALRLSGGTVEPTVVQPVRFVPGETLRIDLAAGATIRGRLVPAARFRALAAADDRERVQLAVVLSAATARGMAPPGADAREARAPVSATGSGRFEFRGVGAGVWRLDLVASYSSGARRSVPVVSRIEVRAGETVDLCADVGAFRPLPPPTAAPAVGGGPSAPAPAGRSDGTRAVRLVGPDGQPAVGVQLRFEPCHELPGAASAAVAAPTDAAGRTRITGRAGRYRVSIGSGEGPATFLGEIALLIDGTEEEIDLRLPEAPSDRAR